MIGIGTRWSDFTTASKSAFQDPGVRFVNINVARFDAAKHGALPLVADARVALEALREALPAGACRAGWEIARAEEAEWWPARSPAAVAPPEPGAPPAPGGGDRRGQRRGRRARRRRLRRRLDCPATCTSSGARATRRQGLPRRVRLLVHGLRDPGRDGRQARGARARGVRAGRRRLLPDGAGRARDRGRRSGSRSCSCWSTTTATRRSARCRARSARHGLRHDRAGATVSAATRCRSTSPPTPRASARGVIRARDDRRAARRRSPAVGRRRTRW